MRSPRLARFTDTRLRYITRRKRPSNGSIGLLPCSAQPILCGSPASLPKRQTPRVDISSEENSLSYELDRKLPENRGERLVAHPSAVACGTIPHSATGALQSRGLLTGLKRRLALCERHCVVVKALADGRRFLSSRGLAHTGPTASALSLIGSQGSFTPCDLCRLAILRAKTPVEQPSRDRRPSGAGRYFAKSRMKT